MTIIWHPALERGIQDHGWLKAAHSFSFANYHNPERMNFGLLRVLNDDIVAPSMGFGTHAHDNMEIVTIPLKGVLAHKDSLGSEGTISVNEVQIMSAGSGIRHSEFNGSSAEEVNLLQIWVFPKVRNIQPRYDQKKFDPQNWNNAWKILVSPTEEDKSMWINQDVYFSIGEFDAGQKPVYQLKQEKNGAYVFLISGSITIDNKKLNARDAIGVFDTQQFSIDVFERAKILVIDVPMN